MSAQVFVSSVLALAGCASVGLAVFNERRMQRHRLPHVSYRDVTLRRDGGWRREDLFAPRGLVHQRRASAFGVAGALLWIVALLTWVLLGARP